MKGLSPVMFEDFVKPFQINLEEVPFFLSLLLNWLARPRDFIVLWRSFASYYLTIDLDFGVLTVEFSLYCLKLKERSFCASTVA